MTDPRETLARIRAQAGAATDGPWEAGGLEGTITSKTDGLVTDPQGPYLVVDGITMWAESDAEFIASSRTTVPALLDALDAAIRVHHLSEFHTLTGPVPWCDECDCIYPCPTVDAITTALEARDD